MYGNVDVDSVHGEEFVAVKDFGENAVKHHVGFGFGE